MQRRVIGTIIATIAVLAIIQAQSTVFAESSNVTITVKTASIDTKPIHGMWIEVKSAETTQSGFSPLMFNVTQGDTYTVTVSDYGSYVFDHWDDGDADNHLSVRPTSDTSLIAYYKKTTDDTTNQKKTTLPDWLKEGAESWLDGNLSDAEFLSILQQLVDQNILVTTKGEPETQEGFSNIKCNTGNRYVEMTGKYTNGDAPYSIVSVRMTLLDKDGNALASNTGTISNIGAHETRYFNVITRHSLDYASCDAQVDSVIPKK